MTTHPSPVEGDPADLMTLYARALPTVYGYLLSRCRHVALAEELTSTTFLAAASAVVERDPAPELSTAWLLGVARHKLVDHWRRQAREESGLRRLSAAPAAAEEEDAWEATLDAMRARETLERLAPQHRAALTLRYVDDLPVAEVAELMDRTLHATEALLVRARAAFRQAYTANETPHA